MSIHVIKQGMQTTVQDLGRLNYAHLGISATGAADSFSLQIGNKLVGNNSGDAALEFTLTGGEIEFTSDSCIAITGSEFDSTIDSRSVPSWTGINIKNGQVLIIKNTLGGARCYVSVSGGIDVPEFLNSRSTHLMTGLGGFKGRALQKGDVINTGDPEIRRIKKLQNIAEVETFLNRKTVRITQGLEGDCFSDDTWEEFLNEEFTVAQSFSRMGLRLEGEIIQSSIGHEIRTQGIPLGAIQVPGNGQPIISFVEHQTTGGYPRMANVITADLCKVGQLKPGDTFQFELVTLKEAGQLYTEQLNFIHNLTM